MGYMVEAFDRYDYDFLHYAGDDTIFVHKNARHGIESSLRELGVMEPLPMDVARCFASAFTSSWIPARVMREWFFSRHVNTSDVRRYLEKCQRHFCCSSALGSRDALLDILNATLIVLPD